MTPVALGRLSELLNVQFTRAVIVSVWVASRPRVPVDERVRVLPLDSAHLRIDVRFGYMQQIDVPPCSARRSMPRASIPTTRSMSSVTSV